MASPVYFTDLRASIKRNLMDKLDSLIVHTGLAQRMKPGGLTAVKLHFGEKGNTAFIRPVYVRRFVDAIKAAGSSPFLTDTGTLYVGTRSNAVSHAITAVENGFAYSVVGAPVLIADGLKSRSDTAVKVDLPECEKVFIADDIVEADAIVSLAHFKGHEVAGYGGAIKNISMGCASRHGKLFMHSEVTPEIKGDQCVACGTCIKRCPASAIKLVKRTDADGPAPEGSQKPQFVARKDPELCIGCGDCILACPEGAISIMWDAQVPELLRRMVAYAKGALTGKEQNCVFFNFITQVSPACDCYPFQDAPIVADLGVAASLDPIALDQACVDLVNKAPGLPGSSLKHALEPGQDKFKDLYPRVDYEVQLEYGQKVGLGSREYELILV